MPVEREADAATLPHPTEHRLDDRRVCFSSVPSLREEAAERTRARIELCEPEVGNGVRGQMQYLVRALEARSRFGCHVLCYVDSQSDDCERRSSFHDGYGIWKSPGFGPYSW